MEEEDMRLPSDWSSLYRDKENGMLLGVCAGLADSLDVDPLLIRIAALLALLVFFVPVVVIYGTAGVLLRERPLSYRGSVEERGFWGGNRRGV
jgi:phage shock protein C